MIPAKTYPGQDADNKIAVVQNILVTNSKMTDKVAYDIVKTLFEKRADVALAHGEAKAIVLDTQNKANTTIPWHPGAAKYFTEKGEDRRECHVNAAHLAGSSFKNRIDGARSYFLQMAVSDPSRCSDGPRLQSSLISGS